MCVCGGGEKVRTRNVWVWGGGGTRNECVCGGEVRTRNVYVCGGGVRTRNLCVWGGEQEMCVWGGGGENKKCVCVGGGR